MKRLLPYLAVGLLGIALGVLARPEPAEEDHWQIIRDYRSYLDDPENYRYEPGPGVWSAGAPRDIGPNLAALVAKGELNHLDMVFPNVPYGREVTRYWMQKCQEIDGLVEGFANHSYVEFKTSGIQPFQMEIWFTHEAEAGVKEMISGIESFARPETGILATLGSRRGWKVSTVKIDLAAPELVVTGGASDGDSMLLHAWPANQNDRDVPMIRIDHGDRLYELTEDEYNSLVRSSAAPDPAKETD